MVFIMPEQRNIITKGCVNLPTKTCAAFNGLIAGDICVPSELAEICWATHTYDVHKNCRNSLHH